MKNIKPIEFLTTERYESNIEKYGFGDYTCSCCGKPMKKIEFGVYTVEGPEVVQADITDEDMESQGIYSQGMFILGPECVKKYPKEYRRKLNR